VSSFVIIRSILHTRPDQLGREMDRAFTPHGEVPLSRTSVYWRSSCGSWAILSALCRLQRSSDNQRKAEACFQHAMTIAQNQGGKAWELRTATSLARLWQHQGKRQQARNLLAPIYHWFTEGFDTADVQDAKVL
jgi:hypothetical protein